MKTYFILFFIFTFFSRYIDDCNKLPKTFFSYNEAINEIKKSNFNFEDDVSKSNSSWVTSANFYSCDGKEGFLIIGLKNRLYIHQGLPIILWNRFKQASSLGSFYDLNIKNRYKLKLNH